jgi:hypothetical protein
LDHENNFASKKSKEVAMYELGVVLDMVKFYVNLLSNSKKVFVNFS